MYNKTIIRFGSADNTYLDLDYSEYHGKNFIQWLLSVTPLASGLETSVHNDVARATFRAEKRSAQASAHPLSQAQGGLFSVLTVFVCCWSSEWNARGENVCSL